MKKAKYLGLIVLILFSLFFTGCITGVSYYSEPWAQKRGYVEYEFRNNQYIFKKFYNLNDPNVPSENVCDAKMYVHTCRPGQLKGDFLVQYWDNSPDVLGFKTDPSSSLNYYIVTENVNEYVNPAGFALYRDDENVYVINFLYSAYNDFVRTNGMNHGYVKFKFDFYNIRDLEIEMNKTSNSGMGTIY